MLLVKHDKTLRCQTVGDFSKCRAVHAAIYAPFDCAQGIAMPAKIILLAI